MERRSSGDPLRLGRSSLARSFLFAPTTIVRINSCFCYALRRRVTYRRFSRRRAAKSASIAATLRRSARTKDVSRARESFCSANRLLVNIQLFLLARALNAKKINGRKRERGVCKDEKRTNFVRISSILDAREEREQFPRGNSVWLSIRFLDVL